MQEIKVNTSRAIIACMRDPDFVTTIEAPGVARASAGTMLKNK